MGCTSGLAMAGFVGRWPGAVGPRGSRTLSGTALGRRWARAPPRCKACCSMPQLAGRRVLLCAVMGPPAGTSRLKRQASVTIEFASSNLVLPVSLRLQSAGRPITAGRSRPGPCSWPDGVMVMVTVTVPARKGGSVRPVAGRNRPQLAAGWRLVTFAAPNVVTSATVKGNIVSVFSMKVCVLGLLHLFPIY